MARQSLILERSERHLLQHANNVLILDNITVTMVVSDLNECSECAFSTYDSILTERVVALNELLALSHSLLENIELTVWQRQSEDTKAIADSLLNKVRFLLFVTQRNLKEFVSKLVHSAAVLVSISVLDIVTEEAKSVKKLVFSQLLVLLELHCEERDSVISNDGISTIFENFNKLSSKLHHLTYDVRHFRQIFLHLLCIFLVDLLMLLLLQDHLLGSLSQGSHKV